MTSIGGKVKIVTDFLFKGFKITADGDCSHEIRRYLLLGRKAMMPLTHASCPLQAGFKRSCDYFWPRTEAILVRLL